MKLTIMKPNSQLITCWYRLCAKISMELGKIIFQAQWRSMVSQAHYSQNGLKIEAAGIFMRRDLISNQLWSLLTDCLKFPSTHWINPKILPLFSIMPFPLGHMYTTSLTPFQMQWTWHLPCPNYPTTPSSTMATTLKHWSIQRSNWDVNPLCMLRVSALHYSTGIGNNEGVSDIGFSSCARLLLLSRSEYFR